MKNVEYLVGSPDITDQPLAPYSDEAVEFAAQLSKNLMKSPWGRIYPDLSALAFWCRKSRLLSLKENFMDAKKRLGRGLCFHIAPGNIPINFAFSYLFGVMAGCSNIVRISSKPYPQIKFVCEVVEDVLKEFPEIAERTAFIRYPAEDEITKEFCKNADVRMIWGGDATISKIRKMPGKPRCIDICFADRYSVCIIDGNAIQKAKESELFHLAEGFYNDTYFMDQNACSSEQIIFWINDRADAREKFWNAVYQIVKEKYKLQAAVGMDKYTHIFEDILSGVPISRIKKETNFLYRVELSQLSGELTELRGKGGYFYEYALNNLEEIIPFITDKFQTLAYFGIEPEQLQNFVIENRLRGIDRIVPVGKAMEIDILWDGFDLATALSRIVDVR